MTAAIIKKLGFPVENAPLEHEHASRFASEVLKKGMEFTVDSSLGLILRETCQHHLHAFFHSAPLSGMYEFAEQTSNRSIANKVCDFGFSLSAAKEGRYEAVIDGENVISTETYPLLVFYDRRVAVRFRTSMRDVCIITDEYWGIPYCIVDLDSCSYFDTGLSTIPSRDGLSLFLAGLAYYVLSGKFGISASKSDGISILTGGNNNIAHFFWNYLGGACVYHSLQSPAPCMELLSLSDCFQLDGSLFSLSSCNRFVPLSGLSWQERLLRTQDSFSRLCVVRLSGFGLLSPLPELLIPAVPSEPSSVDLPLLLTLTVRSTNRRLIDQVEQYVRVVHACHRTFGTALEVLIDGPCLQSNQLFADTSHPEYEVIGLLLKRLKALGVRCRSMAGRTLTDQIREASSSHCVLTYFSGGNAKFTGIVSCPIIFLCPPCDVSRAHIRTFQQLPAFFASDSVKEHFSSNHFFMDPSYLSYPKCPIPFLTPDPDCVTADNSSKGLASDFSVETHHLIELVTRSLAFSRQQHDSLKLLSHP